MKSSKRWASSHNGNASSVLLSALAALLGLLPVAVPADDRVLLNACINQIPVRLAFDTGAECSVLFGKAATRVGLKPTETESQDARSTGTVQTRRAADCWLELGGARQKFGFRIVEETGGESWDVDGCLAWQDVRRRIVHLSTEQGLCTISDTLPSDLNGWARWRLVPDSKLLTFGPTNGDPAARIGIDTGCPCGVQLSPERWTPWRRAHKCQPATVEALYTPSDGIIISEVLRVKNFELFGFALKDVPVALQPPSFEPAFQHSDAVLGLFVFSQLEVVIDGTHDVLYTRPFSKPVWLYNYNRLGAVFVPRNSSKSDDLEAVVAEGSEAARAGIHNGDLLLRIDGLNATRWRTEPSLMPLARFWSQAAGTKMQLQLKRNDQIYEVSVTLKDITF